MYGWIVVSNLLRIVVLDGLDVEYFHVSSMFSQRCGGSFASAAGVALNIDDVFGAHGDAVVFDPGGVSQCFNYNVTPAFVVA